MSLHRTWPSHHEVYAVFLPCLLLTHSPHPPHFLPQPQPQPQPWDSPRPSSPSFSLSLSRAFELWNVFNHCSKTRKEEVVPGEGEEDDSGEAEAEPTYVLKPNHGCNCKWSMGKPFWEDGALLLVFDCLLRAFAELARSRHSEGRLSTASLYPRCVRRFGLESWMLF